MPCISVTCTYSYLLLLVGLLLVTYSVAGEFSFGFLKGDQANNVRTTCMKGTTLWAGGTFNIAGSNRAGNIASYDHNTGIWNSELFIGINITLTAYYNELEIDDLTGPNPESVRNEKYLGTVMTIACPEEGDYIYVGGTFSFASIADTSDNLNVNNFFRYDTVNKKIEYLSRTENGVVYTGFDTMVDDSTDDRSKTSASASEQTFVSDIECITADCEQMYVTGKFNIINGYGGFSNIALLNASSAINFSEPNLNTIGCGAGGVSLTCPYEGTDGPIYTMVHLSDSIYVIGGAFANAGSVTTTSLVLYDANTDLIQCIGPEVGPVSLRSDCLSGLLGPFYDVQRISNSSLVAVGNFNFEVYDNDGHKNISYDATIIGRPSTGGSWYSPQPIVLPEQSYAGYFHGSSFSCYCYKWNADETCAEMLIGGKSNTTDFDRNYLTQVIFSNYRYNVPQNSTLRQVKFHLPPSQESEYASDRYIGTNQISVGLFPGEVMVGGTISRGGNIFRLNTTTFNATLLPDVNQNPIVPRGFESCYTDPAALQYGSMIGRGAGICCPNGYLCADNLTALQCDDGYGFRCPLGTDHLDCCPPGFYCPWAGEQILCPMGYFCPNGSSIPSPCTAHGPFSICNEGGLSKPNSWLSCLLGGFVACMLLFVFPSLIAALINRFSYYQTAVSVQIMRDKLKEAHSANDIKSRPSDVIPRASSLSRGNRVSKLVDETAISQEDDSLGGIVGARGISYAQTQGGEADEEDEFVPAYRESVVPPLPNFGHNTKERQTSAHSAIVSISDTYGTDDGGNLSTTSSWMMEHGNDSDIETDAGDSLMTELPNSSQLYEGWGAPYLPEMFNTKRTKTSALIKLEKKRIESVKKGLDQIPVNQRITLDFKHLTVNIRSEGKKRVLLQDVTGTLEAGKVTAIMGSSGCGKTTLLTALASRIRGVSVKGQFLTNGVNVHLPQLQNFLGFVPQDDIMHRDLTVFQVLYYQCCLRADRNKYPSGSQAQIDMVYDIMSMLGLLKVKDSLIGDTAIRGISGGQRKRVNIGMELMCNPKMLFLDEPTSGLDSTTSVDILRYLHQYAKTGLTVSLVIHQPRVECIQYLDNVVLLKPTPRGGRAVFAGPMKKAMRHMKNVGLPIPLGVNPADYFLDVMSDNNVRTSSGKTLEDEWEEYIKTEDRYSAFRFSAAGADFVNLDSGNDEGDDYGNYMGTGHTTYHNQVIQRLKWEPPNLIAQFAFQVMRSIHQQYNMLNFVLVDFAVLMIGGIFIGSLDMKLFGQFFIVQLAIGAISCLNGVKLFGSELIIGARERESGISVSMYFLGKLVASIPKSVMNPFAFLSVYYYMSECHIKFHEYYLILFIMTIIGHSIGICVSFLSSPNSAQVTAVVIALCFSCFAGNTITLKEMNESNGLLLFIGSISFSRWCFQQLILLNYYHQSRCVSTEVLYNTLYLDGYIRFNPGILLTDSGKESMLLELNENIFIFGLLVLPYLALAGWIVVGKAAYERNKETLFTFVRKTKKRVRRYIVGLFESSQCSCCYSSCCDQCCSGIGRMIINCIDTPQDQAYRIRKSRLRATTKTEITVVPRWVLEGGSRENEMGVVLPRRSSTGPIFGGRVPNEMTESNIDTSDSDDDKIENEEKDTSEALDSRAQSDEASRSSSNAKPQVTVTLISGESEEDASPVVSPFHDEL